ncbi:MAG TPA: phosphotransferase [Pseudonocardiaceae bacterium]|nr:phosphotransferase [Pseudonocardiaceae bacterium]
MTIEWDGSFMDRTIPIQQLIDEVFGSQGGFNASIVRLLPLSGGESGAAVLRAIVKSPHSRVPYVLKCGHEYLIAREREAYRRWNEVTTLWNGAPPHDMSHECSVDERGVAWSAILYKLAGNTGEAEDLISLEDCVSAFTADGARADGPSWSSTFRTLARTLASAYETPGPDMSAAQLLAVPIKPLRAILSSVTAVAAIGPENGTVQWTELFDSLSEWESYTENLRRDVRTTVSHGDLRGANVLLNGDTHHPFLIDFGSVGVSSPIMDLARLEVDLLVRAGNLKEDEIPRVHAVLFDEYSNPTWADSPFRIVRVVHHLRTAFERVIQQGLDSGRLTDEIRLFHACRVVTAAKMLRWSDDRATSPGVRRHLLWMVLEGIRRVVGNTGTSEGARGMRALPRPPDPLIHQAADVGLFALHHPKDWPSRNRAKLKLLETTDDVWLIAHSGWSYLVPEGVLFSAMQERVEKARQGERGRTRILVLSPYNEESITRALQQAPEATDLEGLRDTRTFTRFTRCLTDFRNMFWKSEEEPAIELRICPFSIGCSVLLADGSMFYEPYNVGLASLRDRMLQTFPEFEFAGPAGARYTSAVREQLEWFWRRSMDQTTFDAAEAGLRQQADQLVRTLSVARDSTR